MTLKEKVGQLSLYGSGWDVTGPALGNDYLNELKAGRVGGILNALTVSYIKYLQKIAVEETRLGIPLLFGYDVIHGYKTIFPIPLAEACSWNMELIEKTAALSAEEASSGGINWTFSPMVDIARDPRWGRVAEGSGEDTYLGCQIAKAKVKGYQGEDLKNTATILACVKHFAAYGAPIAGRDYGTVDMSDRVLREIYLPPYKAAIDAGVTTIMSSFNEVDGVPASASDYLLKKILRDEWNFNGFVVTDYNTIKELISHGVASDENEAAELALNAGVDMDMQSGVYMTNLESLVKEGKLEEKLIDDAVRRILILKYKLGLFDDPYLYLNEEREKETLLSDKMLDHSLEAARESIVLLKNDVFKGEKILPISKNIKSVAVIGPMGDNKIDMLGSWHATGDESKVINLLEGLQRSVPDIIFTYAKGCGFNGKDKSGFAEAINLAEKSELVILAMGENHLQNGEAASRSNIDLPGVQLELLKEIRKTDKPVVVLVMAGRPLAIEWIDENIPAIVNTWHLGTAGGIAVAQVLFGDYNPSAKLTMSFPRNEGQIPIFYNDKNTGRPFNKDDKYTTKYIDVPNTPLYPFGYGLSYTNFEYGEIQLDKSEMGKNEKLHASVIVTNTGNYDGGEVVQLYIRDLVGSVTRPVKELKGFEKIYLKKGASQEVTFEISKELLSFYRKDMSYGTEPGEFEVFVGGSSDVVQSARFSLK